MRGYVSFADKDTNISDRVIIRGFEMENSIDGAYTEYVFDKITSRLMSRKTSDIAYLPYTVALEILDEALSVDKKNRHYVELSFRYDGDGKLDMKTERIVKEAFPLPHKSFTYQPRCVLADITEKFTGKKLLTNLEASLYAYNYNNILIRSGFVGDRVFYYSCGRLLMQTDWLMESVKGRRQLKKYLPGSYDAIRSVSSPFVKKFGIRLKSKTYESLKNESYDNNFLKAHSLVSERLADVNIEHAIKHPEIVTDLVEKQLEIYRYEFEREYYKNLVTSVSAYDYLDIKDILRFHIDADFRVNLDKYIADIRKIYNANKERKAFKVISSDGRLL